VIRTLLGLALLTAGNVPFAEASETIQAVVDLKDRGWVRRPSAAQDDPLPGGSLFKLVTALAALESGAGQESFACQGAPCWLKGGHGRLDLDSALAQSCSSYFAQLASRLDASRVLALSRSLGFEPGGRLPSPLAFAGDHPSLQIRPTRAALLMAFLAAGEPGWEVAWDRAAGHALRRALVHSASVGTASGLLSRLPRAAGKTGTAFTFAGRLLGWCAGFVPEPEPRYAFAVVVFGATARDGAVPEAAQLMRRVLEERN
jgi:cell division protein FtsI/penicillin-binding protein 2